MYIWGRISKIYIQVIYLNMNYFMHIREREEPKLM